METKKFYKQVNFYLTAAALLFVLIGALLYGLNCGSEFNGGKPASNVIGGDVAAIVCILVSLALAVLASVTENGIVKKIAEYGRFFLYAAFVLALYAFLSSILAEYSLLGTILYPIVSGTVGDPVDGTLAASYFTQLILTFAACVLALSAGLVQKSAKYKAERAATERA